MTFPALNDGHDRLMRQQSHNRSQLASHTHGMGLQGLGMAASQSGGVQSYRDEVYGAYIDSVYDKPVKKSAREELQAETDEWLKGVGWD